MYYVYILRSLRHGRLYVGITTDLRRRLADHNNGKGGRHTRANGPWELVYSEPQQDRSTATKREAFLKSPAGLKEKKRLAESLSDNNLKELVAPHITGQVFERIEPLLKGYSHDHKYIVWCAGAPRFLLRMTPAQSLKRRQIEYDALLALSARGIRCPAPVAVGLTPCGSMSFSLVEYIMGDDAEQILPGLPEDLQYRLGLDAGLELWRIHQLTADEPHNAWLERRVRKYRRRVEEASRLGLTFFGQHLVEEYIERHLGLLEGSLVRFQHDDYHPANMIIKDGKWAGIVDFNRCDVGDPIEEFYKVPWFTIRSSVHFARGQVDGYMEASGIGDFWARYSLFVALNLHGSLVWEHENGSPERQSQWLGFVREIVETHDCAGNGPPKWYKEQA